jgi:hypothetical protein
MASAAAARPGVACQRGRVGAGALDPDCADAGPRGKGGSRSSTPRVRVAAQPTPNEPESERFAQPPPVHRPPPALRAD